MHPYVVKFVCVCIFKTNNKNTAIVYPSIQCNCGYKGKFGTEIIIT